MTQGDPASRFRSETVGGDQNPEHHLLPLEAIYEELNPNGEKGLSQGKATELLAMLGPNELEQPPRISLLMLFFIQLNSVVMYLLLGAVIASATINAIASENPENFLTYIDSIAILIIVLLNASIAAFTENNANDALEALTSLQSPMSLVVRDGEEVEIASREIVPGDIVKLKTGDVVPADVRNIHTSDFRVNEMLLTGEPEDVSKNTIVKPPIPGHPEKLTADCMAFSSCQVKAGTCVGIVVATGMKTRVGSIAALLNDTGGDDEEEDIPEDAADIEEGKSKSKKKKTKKKKKKSCIPDTKANWTPLQVNLEALAVKIGYMAIAVCVVVFVVGVLLNTTDPESPETPSWLYMILIAVTLTVAAIPEGLPLCVTISLSSGCSSMVSENVLMRKIAAVETLGSASIICTDKTGTLTEGKMTLVAMHAGGIDYTVTGKGFDPTVGGITKTEGGEDASSSRGVVATLGSAVLCSDTKLVQEKDEDTGNVKWVPKGNSSEAPLIVAGQKIKITRDELDVAQPQTYQIPFSSSRKMMVTITKTAGDSILKHLAPMGEYTAHIKGAPNYIMEKCTMYMDADGNELPLDEAEKARLMSKVDALSSRALRVLAVATVKIGAELPYGEDDDTDDKFAKLVQNCTFCGMCASIDPERDGVKDAVTTSKTAGVRVVMITGDYLKTAQAIAMNIHILNPRTFVEGNGEAVDCGDLRPGKDGDYLPHHEIDELTKKTSVFARAKPEDKLEIVKSLQRQGWVCAMTGDGVNDAPALQKSDIGVAMGLEGTEVAKGASDMILTDDNFCSIVKAIEKGRVIYSGIQKFISFIMSVHFAEVLQIFLCIVIQLPVMRQPLQILFLIIVTDLPPSIALGFEPGEPQTMLRKPRPKSEPVVLKWMWAGIVANGLFLTASIMMIYVIALWAYAGAFNVFEIIDPLREGCAIWGPDTWYPSVDFTCTVPPPVDVNRWMECTPNPTPEMLAVDPVMDQYECIESFDAVVGSVPFAVMADEKWDELRANETTIDAAIEAAGGEAAARQASDAELEAELLGVWDSKGENMTGLYFSYYEAGCLDCIEKSIRRARTTAFISLVWAEGMRAYSSRSFENPVWVNMFSNKYMNYAVLLAQVRRSPCLRIPYG